MRILTPAILVLLLAGVGRADEPAAEWWRAQVTALFAPAEVRIGYSKIRVEADQSIVITSPTMIFCDGPDGKPVLLTADRITLRPEGKLDVKKPLALAEITIDRPILNLMLLPRPGALPSTRSSTQPSDEALREVLKTLKSVAIHDGVTVFPVGEKADHANIVRGSASAERDEHGEWAANIETDAIGEPVGIFLPRSATVDLRFKINTEDGKLAVQADINAMAKDLVQKRLQAATRNSR